MILYAKHAFYTSLTGTDDIQWMPPGKHTIHPSNDKGEVVERTVLVDAAAAEAVEELRRKLQEGAADGLMDEPYIDYDHQDHDAAGWVKRIYWGGDDPKTGGIRAEIEWTPEGKAKVEGKSYRRFSPVFQASEPDGDGVCRIIGSGINMGGLVNRAAFQSIAPLLGGKDGNPAAPANQTQTANTTMTDEEIKALQAQLDALKTENEELKKSLTDMKAKAADTSVEKACEEGRISPDLKASWKEMILADPKAEILLSKLPVNPVFSQQYKAGDNKGDGTKPKGETLLAKLDSIKDPNEQLRFYRDNKNEILAARSLSH